jgi:hemerythrin superfamily protein
MQQPDFLGKEDMSNLWISNPIQYRALESEFVKQFKRRSEEEKDFPAWMIKGDWMDKYKFLDWNRRQHWKNNKSKIEAAWKGLKATILPKC